MTDAIFCEVTSVDQMDMSPNFPAIVINLGMPFRLIDGNDPLDITDRQYLAYIVHNQTQQHLIENGVAVHGYGSIIINAYGTSADPDDTLDFIVYDKTGIFDDLHLTALLDETNTEVGGFSTGVTINKILDSVRTGYFFKYGLFSVE